MIEECKVNFEHREIQGRSPIYFAASKGNITLVKYLISIGANVNSVSVMGRNAMLKSTWNGEVEMVKVFLEDPNLDLNIQDGSGRTALHMASWGQFGGRNRTKASMYPRDCPELVELFLKNGADPNIPDIYGKLPIDTSCSSGGAESIPHLVKAGVNINNQDPDGITPLHECFYRGNTECLQTFI